jgi:hypothetical protein
VKHLYSVKEILGTVFRNEEKVSLTTWFSILALCIFDDGLHQFHILRLTKSEVMYLVEFAGGNGDFGNASV